jgi:hypothetical protein
VEGERRTVEIVSKAACRKAVERAKPVEVEPVSKSAWARLSDRDLSPSSGHDVVLRPARHCADGRGFGLAFDQT